MLSFGQTIVHAAAGLKSRKKFHFEVAFTLEDLSNCTYVSGVLFAKIRLKEGGHFSHSSRRVEIDSHKVSWEEEVKFSCKLYASANTAELEPCICKVSVRKETRGGRSYKKLGYVPINLSEFAGAGSVHRKYLLESYNENKHKPDNSILRVKVALRQTSGDVLFKAPRPPVWEISEPEQDEGIQVDLQSSRRVNARVSTASTLSGFSGGSGSGNVPAGSSVQDMRVHVLPSLETKSSSACSLHARAHASSDSGSSEYESASQHSSSSGHQERNAEGETEASSSEVQEVCREKPGDCLDQKEDSHAGRSNSVAGSELRLPPGPLPDNYSLSYPRVHRRQPDNSGSGSPSKIQHRRIQSLSITPNSSRSTSAYSTLSERSVPVVASEDTESVVSSKSRVTTQSQVEQSRVDTGSVIDELLQQQQSVFSCSAEEEPPGLQIYVDRSKGDVVVAGPDMERRDVNLKPIQLPAAHGRSRRHHKSASPEKTKTLTQPSNPLCDTSRGRTDVH